MGNLEKRGGEERDRRQRKKKIKKEMVFFFFFFYLFIYLSSGTKLSFRTKLVILKCFGLSWYYHKPQG